jgi:hypothetical protein
MNSVLVIVGLIAIAIVFASLFPPPRIRPSNLTKEGSLPPPVPPEVREHAQAAEAKDVGRQESEPDEIDAVAIARLATW